MMSLSNKVAPIVMTSIDSATFTGNYQLLSGPAGIAQALIMMQISNDSDENITISYDGVNDNDFLLAGLDRELQFQTNSSEPGKVAMLPKGTKVYVKGTAGSGSVYLAGWYISKQ